MTRLCSIRAFQPPGNFCGRQRRCAGLQVSESNLLPGRVAVSRRLANLQETLFIIRNANLFRTTAGEVYQVAWASSIAELAFACLCNHMIC